MFPRTVATSLAWRPAAFVGLTVVILLFTQPGLHGQATPGNSPTYFRNFYLTGDTLVFGKGLKRLPVQNGVVTADLTTTALPPNATAVAAYLYFAHVVTTSTLNAGLTNAMFRGQPITSANAVAINPQGTSACWSQGGGTGGEGTKRMAWYRVDALPYFDRDVYGRPIINGVNHTLQLVSSSNNSTPVAEGAGLVVVYKSPSDPFRGIVIYDGGFVIDQGHPATETAMHGYYQASTTGAQMSLTVLAAEGQTNFNENLKVNGQLISSNPFTSTAGTQNAWDNPRFDNLTQLGVSNIDDSASVTVRIDNVGLSNFDCVDGGAYVLGTTLQDQDGDGLLDKWETSTAENDPNGKPLPDLKAMGADKTKPDIFIEMAATYETQQYTSGGGMVTPHNHLPNPYVLKQAAEPFLNKGIEPHFDVGPDYANTFSDSPGGYVCNEPVPANWSGGPTSGLCLPTNSPFIIQGSLARGGELIHELVLDSNDDPILGTCVSPSCQFFDYPGTIGWKFGLEYFRDQFERKNGEHLSPAEISSCNQTGHDLQTTPEPCRPRFDRGLTADANDRNRFAMFHFGLYAHYIGEPVNPDPSSPDYHVPRTISGRGDLSGGDYLETLGGWGNNFTGPEFVQASTTVHEVGHNFWLTHRGILFGDSPTYTLLNPVELERNCNPNYLSSMSYTFQVQGLRKLDGIPRADYSAAQTLTGINENALPIGLGKLDYLPSYYVPFATAAGHTLADIATKHCDGTTKLDSEQMVRITGLALNTATTSPPAAGTVGIDWNGDLNTTNDYPNLAQDVSFNGTLNPLLVGNADWSFVLTKGLQQLASRRTAGGFSLNGQDNGGQDNGGQDNGGQDNGGQDNGGQDNGGQDNGGQDNGGQDNGGVDQDFATATAYPVAAHSFDAMYIAGRTPIVRSSWGVPIVLGRTIQSFLLYKAPGQTLDATAFANKTLVQSCPANGGSPCVVRKQSPSGEPLVISYDEPKPKKGQWVYWVIVQYGSSPGVGTSLSDNSNPDPVIVQ